MTDLMLETQFDKEFQKIEKLKWFPYVGKEYCNLPEGKKILIIAESHYLPNEDKTWYYDVKTQGFTRQFILKQIANPNNDMEKILLNFQNIFLGDEPSEKQKNRFWNSLSYYNFIQRELASSNRKDRPNSKEFSDSWDVFFELINHLKPDLCLFGGITASNENGKFIQTARKNMFVCPDIGIQKGTFESRNVKAREVSITKEGKELPIRFILHPSNWQYPFISSEWKNYIDIEMTDYTNWLRNDSSTNSQLKGT